MYVGRVMHKDLITVTPGTPIARVRKLMDEKRINHLLVTSEDGKLVGILSDRDVRQSWASPATSLSTHELNYLLGQLTVDMIMIKKLITVSPDTTVERAAHVMQENRINALPVMEDGGLVGIITSTDVMGLLLEAIGIDRGDSRRFVVLVDHDRVGFVAEMTQILKEEDISIRSFFSWPDKEYPGVYHLVLRVKAEYGNRAVEALRARGFRVLTEYVADIGPLLPDPAA